MLDRETLEAMAIEAVCACDYYDLMDCIDATSDKDLQAIIDDSSCAVCEPSDCD